ncbi:MAG: cupin domain-containing protein [Mariniphaga sp.]
MENVAMTSKFKQRFFDLIIFVFYPAGIIKVWTLKRNLWLRLVYTILGLPLFLLVFSFLGVVVVGSFLPSLDMSIGNRTDRTLFNSNGNYSVTFVKSGLETGGSYELVEVELEPNGGNDWHYHKTFDEQFKVLEGVVTIGLENEVYQLNPGDSVTAFRNQIHFFRNTTDKKAKLLVKTNPARGLEKTIRVGYGLANDGQFDDNGLTRNLWHMVLLMGYSESYFDGIPAFIQEPVVNNLARIAQWKGEDKELFKYFK